MRPDFHILIYFLNLVLIHHHHPHLHFLQTFPLLVQLPLFIVKPLYSVHQLLHKIMYPIPFPLKTLHPIPLLLSLQILFLNLSLNQLLMILSQNFLLPLLLHLIPPPPMSQPPIILFLTILLLCRPGLSLVLCKPDFIPHYFSESKSVKQAFQDPNCQAAVVATIAAKNSVCSSY